MDPIPWSGTAQAAIDRLAKIIGQTPRARIVTRNANYLRAEFVTAIFRFVDDVEFFVDEPRGVVHFRSASRVGYLDLGQNRRRMTNLRRQFLAT
jgi:uncharacterized protein (DUF1499 family)